MEGDAVAATIRAMVEGGVAMTSTLAVYELGVPNRPPLEERVLEMLAPGARDEYLASRADVASRDDAPMATLFPKAQRFEKLFADAGGLLAAGVDPTGMGGALPGYGDQRNYELLLEAGFTPEEVVEVMTLNGARVLGEDTRYGSVEAGKLADLIVIDGDPVRRPAEIRNVTLVFKEGRRLRRARPCGVGQGHRRPAVTGKSAQRHGGQVVHVDAELEGGRRRQQVGLPGPRLGIGEAPLQAFALVAGEQRGVLADVRTEIADVRTEIAGVHTAIAKLGEQQARTETHPLRWTLGAIVAGSALSVPIPAPSGRLNPFAHAT